MLIILLPFAVFICLRSLPEPKAPPRSHIGVRRALAIVAWIAANVDYRFGVSGSETTAARTFIDRAGVCRDFTHLGITLCRAAGIPARAVSAYADQLRPPDFHAVFEVWLSGGWWLIDPTGLAPIAVATDSGGLLLRPNSDCQFGAESENNLITQIVSIFSGMPWPPQSDTAIAAARAAMPR